MSNAFSRSMKAANFKPDDPPLLLYENLLFSQLSASIAIQSASSKLFEHLSGLPLLVRVVKASAVHPLAIN
jgi:hypothetical protein